MKNKNENENKPYQGFTLVEMLVVLFVIGALILLFVPNLSGQRAKIDASANEAFTKVVATQVELFRLSEEEVPTYRLLEDRNYLTGEQIARAKKLGIKLTDVIP